MAAKQFLLATLMSVGLTAHGQTLTAAEAIATIQHRYAASPPADIVDTIKAGDPSTPVTGIATTFLDTMDVLREAARRGDNLVITHEPTFYNHRDETSYFTDDPVYQEKLAFIQQHHLVVFRLHDEIHAGGTDHILAGLYATLGWKDYPHPTGPYAQYFVTVPPTTLLQMAQTLQQRLHIATLRIEGDPQLAVSHVAVLPGASGLNKQVLALRQPGIDLLIAGEASEWETVEYVRDAVAQGKHKGLILLGHEVSEEPGMEQCARELREVFPALHVDHIEAGQPLWNPDHPPASPMAR
jgi:putative NIF3 family GTP cyclohydrolase 1 type 2